MIQSEKEVGFNIDVVKDESGLIHDKLGMREVIKAPPSLREGSLAKDVLSGSISCNVSSELAKQERCILLNYFIDCFNLFVSFLLLLVS